MIDVVEMVGKSWNQIQLLIHDWASALQSVNLRP